MENIVVDAGSILTLNELKEEDNSDAFKCIEDTCIPKTNLSALPGQEIEGSRVDLELKRMIMYSLGFKKEGENMWSHYLLGNKKGEVVIEFDLATEPLDGLLIKFLKGSSVTKETAKEEAIRKFLTAEGYPY